MSLRAELEIAKAAEAEAEARAEAAAGARERALHELLSTSLDMATQQQQVGGKEHALVYAT